MTPQSIRIGKFEIPEPCTVPWEEMQDVDGCNRHCAVCSKVVHDLSGKTLSEIERLFEAAGGELCGSFSIDDKGNPIFRLAEPAMRKPVYLKHLAVAASLFLVYQTPQAKPIAIVKPRMEASPPGESGGTVPTEKTNTLVTGVILDQFGNSTHDSLLVKVRCDGKTIDKCYSSAGLFRFELGNLLKPDAQITISVTGNQFDQGIKYRARSYGHAECNVVLGKAQNVSLQVHYNAPDVPRKTAGKMIKSVY